ncbi:16474_t:CDS:2 [Entrophospora sp. SA101]|nr:5641_t:CDS:2 [Entrophospora sp. SA101]CAJ0761224.1 16474_t:CDS:2 [Entrophospora sp. SA101]CAJ0912303.1 9088_t:CDS:2 [Entrophospora sp. SA101]
MNKKEIIDIQPLLKTKLLLEKALQEGASSELEEMGGIQAFEMAYELIMNLQLEEKHGKIIQQILRKYPYHFYAYGSRVKGTARKHSDLDLCYQEEIPLSVISQMREEFAESNLPFEVELVN